MKLKHCFLEVTNPDLVSKTINLIKTQIGVELELDDYFTGLKYHKGKPYFNVKINDPVSESKIYTQLDSFSKKYGLISIEPNGNKRIAVFPNTAKIK